VAVVEQAERPIVEAALEELQSDGVVRDVRDRGEYATLGGEERTHLPEHGGGVAEVLQHVREDHDVEQRISQFLAVVERLGIPHDDAGGDGAAARAASGSSSIPVYNEAPKPFVWTKTADEILASVVRFCHRISDSGHQTYARSTGLFLAY
jgi:hypothetical protein